MEHKHEGTIGTDGIIRCRTCGQILPEFEETISRVSSGRRARGILDNIAVTGRYIASGFNDRFVVYSKIRGGLTEEISARKLGERDFEVFKRVISI